MEFSLGISGFLEEISSLSHSIVFLYFFALITEGGFLVSPCYSLEFCIQMGLSFLFSFAFCFSSFHTRDLPVAQMVKASAYNAKDQGSISGSGRFPWRRKWQPTPVLIWKIPWTDEEPGRLQSMGSQRVGHDWATSYTIIKCYFFPWGFKSWKYFPHVFLSR